MKGVKTAEGRRKQKRKEGRTREEEKEKLDIPEVDRLRGRQRVYS